MVLKLIETIVGLVALAFFLGFNLDNRCDVSVIFYTFKDVPVFITIVASFIIGVIFTVPFAFLFQSKRKRAKSDSKGVLSAKSASAQGGESKPQADRAGKGGASFE